MSTPPLVRCPYCNERAKLTNGARLFDGKLSERVKFWRCWPCNAHVACHPDTLVPMGTLADRKTRLWRHRAHRAFDELWRRDKRYSRTQWYKWLADQLGMSRTECHMACFDVQTCVRVVELCKAVRDE